MKTLLTFCSLLFYLSINAQQLDLQTISTLGGKEQNTNTEWTVGEVIIDGNDRLTQGFHQGNFLVTSLFQTPDFPEVLVFPNPTIHSITIEGKTNETIRFTMLNEEGKKVYQNGNARLPYKLELENYLPGSYFLHLSTEHNRFKVFKIQKIK